MYALIILLGVLVYWVWTSSFNYWKDRGVPTPPVSKLFGNLRESLFAKKSLGQAYDEIYKAYPNLPYVGLYKVRQPAVLIRDIDLVQDVFIRQFSSFHDNDIQVDEKADPVFGRNPFVLRGERWKVVRNQLLPSFSNKKLKAMFPLIDEVGNIMVKYVGESAEATGVDGLEAKELSAKFTTDNVASCAFGLDGKSFLDPKAEFRAVARKFLTPTLKFAIQNLLIMAVPTMAKLLQVKFFPDEVTNYLRRVVKDTMRYRKENGITRGDFLDLMMEFKERLGEDQFNDDDIVAHAGGFFGDGLETSSVTLSYTLYALAANPDVQERLRQEIDAVIARDGKLTYDNLQEMTYLDNVLMEGLRMYPPLPFNAKLCTKPYKLPSPYGKGNGPDVTLEPGMNVVISNYGIHHDPKYYPDPEKFDPDRFLEENKSRRPKCTFLSFGEGPRICLGQRFGVTQVKVGIVKLISNFEIKVNKKTKEPLEIDPLHFLMKVKGDIWLNLYKRKT